MYVSRRNLLRSATSAALAALSAPYIIPSARATHRTLKILQWNHFVPAFDEWFNNTYVKEWGEQNHTEVIVDNVGMTSIASRAIAEVDEQRGHDLVMFLSPPASYEDQVIDHREIHEECLSRYGKPLDLATNSTYNPKTKKYFGFSDSYVPDPVNYRKDLWDDIGVVPATWDDIRIGGAKIKAKHKIPVGIGMAPDLDSNMGLRSIMAAFGASVQGSEGQLLLHSKETLEALRFMKALYNETMTDEVFTWDASSNNRMMLAGRGSLALNAISITRTGEAARIPVADNILLSRSAAGPSRQVGLHHLLNVYVIWKFAENISGAKKFLIDYVKSSREAFLASRFYNLPCYPATVPDLSGLVSTDSAATPKDKYALFTNATDWTVNLGYPGFANAAIDEIFVKGTIPAMFARAASGSSSIESALSQAVAEANAIFDKWRERGMV